MYQNTDNNRFHLPRRGAKYTCPNCNGKKSFRRYIDEQTGEELANNCGICDHINSCGYHYPPRELFHDYPELRPHDEHNNEWMKVQYAPPTHKNTYSEPTEYHQTEFFDFSWAEKAAQRKSTFHTWFESLAFDTDMKEKVLSEYLVGATEKDIILGGVNHGPAVVFWQIDELQRVHDAKLMAYTADGHRVQGWGNSMRSICEKAKNGPQLQETEKVLFGLHLLNRYPDKVVCIVESEKTALICACQYPQYLWLATGGCGNLQQSKLRPLMNRTIIVYPDSGEYEKWSERMKESGHKHYTVFDLLEAYEPNTDIADIILGEARHK